MATPLQRQININKNVPGPAPRVTFDPDPLAAFTRDQIFWTNNDTEPHWPGLLNADGTINTTFFMPNQIAGNGDTSATFSPSTPATFTYVCSLHKDEKGTITITPSP
jgi:plastocyanin